MTHDITPEFRIKMLENIFKNIMTLMQWCGIYAVHYVNVTHSLSL